MSQPHFIFGIHAVNALLLSKPEQVIELIVLSGRDDQRLLKLIQQAELTGVRIDRRDRAAMDKLVGGFQHQGVIAQTKLENSFTEHDIPSLLENSMHAQPLILVLDGVQDPHNLGACLRSANAHQVDFVLAPKDRAVGLTQVARKVACGAAEMTPFIQVTNLARCLRNLQERNIWLVGTAMHAESPIYDIDLRGGIAIVLGSEGKGIRQLTEKQCDFLASIPMQGDIESLNVSVSAGICLYEAQRQRKTAIE